jgi:hypothetical protein
MRHPTLAQVAYEAYRESREADGYPVASCWGGLSASMRFAWGVAVQRAVEAAHELPCPLHIIAPRRGSQQPTWSRKARHAGDPLVREVYRLVHEDGLSRRAVCQRLHISVATYHRYLKLEKQARGGRVVSLLQSSDNRYTQAP